MTQEEKLEEAKRLYKDANADQRYVLERLFPQLIESNDERIRKALIENFKWFCGDFPETTTWGKDDDLLVKDIIAWLEKQGGTKDKLNTMLDDSLSRETKETWNKFLDEQKPVKIDEGRAKMMFIWALEEVEERTNKGYKLTDNDKNSWWNDFKTYALSGK